MLSSFLPFPCRVRSTPRCWNRWRIIKNLSWLLLLSPIAWYAIVEPIDARRRDSIDRGMTQADVENRLRFWHAYPEETCQEINAGYGSDSYDFCHDFSFTRSYSGTRWGLDVYYDAQKRVDHTLVRYED